MHISDIPKRPPSQHQRRTRAGAVVGAVGLAVAFVGAGTGSDMLGIAGIGLMCVGILGCTLIGPLPYLTSDQHMYFEAIEQFGNESKQRYGVVVSVETVIALSEHYFASGGHPDPAFVKPFDVVEDGHLVSGAFGLSDDGHLRVYVQSRVAAEPDASRSTYPV